MSYTQPLPEPQGFQIRDVMTLTARLAQVLAEEVDLLSSMQVSKIEALQKEKLFLVNGIEAQKKLMEKYPHARETIPSQDREDLEDLLGVFQNVLDENHRRLRIAREVNQYVVKAITKVVKEKAASRYYNGAGTTDVPPSEVLSVTLNKMI